MECPIDHCSYAGYTFGNHFEVYHNDKIIIKRFNRMLENIDNRMNKIKDGIKTLETKSIGDPMMRIAVEDSIAELRKELNLLQCILNDD